MIDRLLHHADFFAFQIKLIVASVIGLAALIADSVTETQVWEDMSLKALLLLALVYVARLYLQQQADHKKEIAETWAAHKKEAEEREKIMTEALKGNTQGLETLTGLTKEQTDYFKAVTRNVLDERLKPAPKLP